jgi:hypothetical protein
LRVRGRLTVDGRSAGWAIGPTLYGHLEDEGETLVLYRDAALRSDYNDGDLAGLRAGGPTDSGPGIRLGRVETFGSMGGME